MDPERWRRLKELFAAAVELPPEDRAPWLAAALPHDPGLAAEVESLLAASESETVDGFYERGALALLPEMLPDVGRQLEEPAEGMRVGPYRLLSELGRGGMGAVYLAVRDEPGFGQKVAVKLIKRGMDTDEIVRRFLAERQILASLAHPNIARLFDGGSTPDGRPYFVMEHVEGRPLTAYADELGLPIEARLRLFLRVCRAVQSAHQSLVVHRDLKPANILVDAAGEPKLLDFGIAKLLDPRSFGGMATLTGLAPGPMTPEYASPEQRAGRPATTATDVYGLGLLLYELLVGRSPQAVAGALGEGWETRPPSQARAALGDGESKRLARRLAGDLDTIVGKALENDPERRYGTVAALADDVERHLAQRPVAARRPTLAYRLGRVLARHRLAALFAFALVLLSAGSFLQVSWQRGQAQAQYRRAQVLNEFLQSMMRRASPEQSRGKTLTLRQALDAGARELESRETRHDAETLVALYEVLGVTYADLGFFDDARRFLERSLRLLEQRSDPDRDTELDIGRNWSLLGHIALRQERYAESRAAYRRALARLPADALSRAQVWSGLGEIAVNEGRLDEAARHLDKALAIGRTAGEGGRDLAEIFNNLGLLEAARGRLARAQLYFGTALRYDRLVLGEDHPDTVRRRSSLASIAFRRGEYDTAEALFREIVEERRRLLGASHPDFALALLNLAILQRHRGHSDAARATLAELLRIRREHRLPIDADEAETLNLLGQTHLDQGELAEAEQALARSVSTYESLQGDHRVDIANVLRGQAQVRRRRADLAGAVALARRSLDLTRAALGDDHPSVAESHQLLAEILQEAGRFPESEAAYRRALALQSGPDWADHTARARTGIGLGSLLVETGRAREARPWLEEGLGIRLRALGAGNPGVAKAESQLGACYAALGDPRARDLLERGHRTLLDLYGPDHPDTRKARERLRRFPSAAN